MPTADRLASPEPREPFSFRMPLVPADYLERSPVLTEEERRGIASLLQLAPARYLEFDRQVRQVSRVTQPLMDVLVLFQQWRPKSRVVRQGFLTSLLDHVLQTNILYWGWSQATWGTVIAALPKRRDLAADQKTRSSPHYVLLHVAAYLFSEAGPSPSSRGIPAHLMAESLFGEASLQQALDRVLQAREARGYTENPKGKRAFVFVLIFALLLNRNPSLEALTPITFDTLSGTEIGKRERGRIEQRRAGADDFRDLSPRATESCRREAQKRSSFRMPSLGMCIRSGWPGSAPFGDRRQSLCMPGMKVLVRCSWPVVGSPIGIQKSRTPSCGPEN